MIYVAPGSHANFFTRGDRGPDMANATGDKLADVEWRDVDAWASWAGSRGNSTGAGRSPDSPGSQGDRWDLPHILHASAR